VTSTSGEEPSGYYGAPVLKAPVWTWEVPLYFFVGGTAGMSAVIALSSLALHASVQIARTAVWIAALGAVLSPLLLVKDLGRPARFYNMLRVFKRRSAMSVGAWLLMLFGAFTVPALALLESFDWLARAGIATSHATGLLVVLLAGAAICGCLLATYTGVLLGATVVPAWFLHRRFLPMHFGVASLGSAASLLLLAGHDARPLRALLLATASMELLLGVLLESRRHGKADRAVRRGLAGFALRGAALASGPAALACALEHWFVPAALTFLGGALLARYGWIWAGRASARDPEAVFAAEEL
jgi:hypothetical protein